MQHRSIGITALAFSSVMIGLYCQYAAMALILAGSVFTPTGSTPAAIALLVGVVFLGLTVAAYFVGYGFWTRKHWSWAGGIALFGVLVGASLVLSFMATDYLSSVSPAVVAVIAVWYLNRPAIRAELLGEKEPARTQSAAPEALEAAGPVR
jgi:hypothetical protein